MGWYLLKLAIMLPLLGLAVWGCLALAKRMQQRINGGEGGIKLNTLRHVAHVVVPLRLRQGVQMAQCGVITIGTGQIQRIGVNLLRIRRAFCRQTRKSGIGPRRIPGFA